MFFDILTLFPGMFEGVFTDSIIHRAVEKGLIHIQIDNIRDYARDRHRVVDDYPYGGDPGMLMKPEPLAEAIRAARRRRDDMKPMVICMSPRGETLDQDLAGRLAAERSLILLCGRYKGIDQRVIDRYVDRELSIGDYVLSGGEIPAMALIDAVTRLIPGALGNSESAGKDSFFDGLLAPPHYTRPEEFEGMRVPDILLSGHHRNIEQWRREQAEALTRSRRPDLWRRYSENSDSANNTQS
jgi:tRNA (guanine37-N1)-methyltransferase